MRRHKKILVSLLVLAFVLWTASAAFAFSDTAGTKYETPANRLASLNILKGYDDGTFKPDKPITRAEFAAVIVRALGLENAAGYAKGATIFPDVAADFWASGYINVAVDQGIIKGYPDGTFKPQAQVTYAESLAMIIRALGYEPTLKGSWPTKYLIKAAELDISKGVTVNANAPALRGDVAVFVDNSLDVPKVIQVGFGDEAKYVVSGTEDTKEQTLLDKNLGAERIEGRVVNISFTDPALDEDEIEIEYEDAEGDLVTDVFVMSNVAAIPGLLGLEVKAWVNDDDEVLFYEVETDAADIIYDSVFASTDDEVQLKVKDDEFAWADGATVYVNYAEEDVLDDVPDGAYGVFVLNEDDEVVFANVFDFDVKAGLVTAVEENEITYRDAATKDSIDLDDYDDVYVYNAKLESLDVEDIEVDDVIYAWADGDDAVHIVVAGDKKEGELETATASKVKVAGTSYNLNTGVDTYSEDADESFNPINVADDLENLLGENVVAILDINGEVRHIRGDVEAVSGLQWAVAIDGTDKTFDSPAKIKVVKSDGTTAVYEFEDSGDYDALATATGDWADDDNVVVAFKLNADGQIADNEIVYLDQDENALAAADADEAPDWLADYQVDVWDVAPVADDDDDYIAENAALDDIAYVSDDTVIYSAIDAEDDDDVETVAWASIEDKDLTDADLVVIREDDGLDAVAVFFTFGYTDIASDVYYGVVTEAPWLTTDGWKVEIDVFGEGKKEYLAASAEVNDLDEGNVVEFELDAEGKISDVTANANSATIDGLSGSYVDIDPDLTKWTRVADDAVLYKLDEDGIDAAIDVNDLEEGDDIYYVADDKGKIVALAVQYEAAAEPEEPVEETTATITGPYVFANLEDVLTVDFELAADDALGNYNLVVYEGQALHKVLPITEDPQQFDGSTSELGLAANKEYTVKVVREDTGAVLATKNIITSTSVDFAAPVIASVTVAAPGVFKDGDTVTLTVDADEAGLTVTADFSALDSGYTAGEEDVTDNGDGTYTVTYTIDAANTVADGTYAVSVVVRDAAGNGDTDSVNVKLDNTDPVMQGAAIADNDSTLETGDTITIVFSESMDTSTISSGSFNNGAFTETGQAAAWLSFAIDGTNAGSYAAAWSTTNVANDTVTLTLTFTDTTAAPSGDLSTAANTATDVAGNVQASATVTPTGGF